MADDAAETIRALQDQARSVEEKTAKTPARIRVTVYAFPGSIVETPELDDDGHETGRFEVRVHPDDWAHIIEMARQNGSPGRVALIEAFGVPVLVEPGAMD